MRGGFWRNFQVKYREINDLHKQMLRASAKVARMPHGPGHDAALRELMQGQSNDCYWHGVFGGIYIAHMRLATYEHLIAAEDAADAAARAAGEAVDGIALVDTDLDGLDEILVTSPGQTVVIDTVEGGGIGSWDIRAGPPRAHRGHAPPARGLPPAPRRQRGCPATGGCRAQRPGGDRRGGDGVASIHAVVRSREPGLADRLQYDGYERRSGLVHLFAPGTTREAFARGRGDGARRCPHRRLRGRRADEPRSFACGRDVRRRRTRAHVVRVEKRFTFDGDRRSPSLDLEVSVENRSAGPVRFDLGVEWALMLLGGGGNPAAYYEIGGERLGPRRRRRARRGHRSSAAATRTSASRSPTTFDPPATAWWTPIETVSNSEYGFERIYQGSALVGIWPMELAPGERRAVSVGQRVATDRDRAAD